MKVTLLTGNPNKVKEAESILGLKINHYALELEEIQSLDPKKVVEHKVREAYETLKKPVFVWDVSVEFGALNGFPGPLIKFFWKSVGLKKVCKIVHELGDNKVLARTTLGYYDGNEMNFFEGLTQGVVPEKPKGEKGWAWDAVFIPDGSEKTFGEMEVEEKNNYSMHRKALEQLKKFLELLN